jgi:integrase
MEKHIALRYAVGRVSQSDEYVLYRFHRFLNRNYPRLKTINRYVILHHLSLLHGLSPWGRRNVVIAIRQFCRFLVSRGIETFVPDRRLVPKLQYKPRYFPLDRKQFVRLMGEIRHASYYRPMVRESYATMLGLLWCTGMRRKEVVQLNHSDVDFREGTVLIRITKFRKTRMVPIKKSAVIALEKYCAFKRKQGFPTGPNDPFFISRDGRRLPGHSLHSAFRRLTRRFGYRDKGGRGPTLHDIRHHFATHTIKRLYSDPEALPPQSYLSTLATFLGHSDIRYSQYYIHPDFGLLMKASEKLEAKQQWKAA